MKKTMMTIAGLGLAGGLAMAAQAQDMQQPNPSQDTMTQPERDKMKQPGHDQMQSQQDGMKSQHDSMAKQKSDLKTKDLVGMSVVTVSGEEIGEIDDVGHTTQQQERVATVDVGGFLGVGEKRIAIPLSQLMISSTDDESVKTSLSKRSIESRPELDDSDFTSETKSSTGMDSDEMDHDEADY